VPGFGPRTLRVPTSEGTRPALPGESYVVRGTQGEWYPISSVVYAACYEPIGVGAQS
jgi:hypothetical protein